MRTLKDFDESYCEIQDLVDSGVLGPELCPTEYYWHWPVLQPADLPAHLQDMYEGYGEIRW